MENNTLKASIGIDFSLIGTKLHAMYEKNEGIRSSFDSVRTDAGQWDFGKGSD